MALLTRSRRPRRTCGREDLRLDCVLARVAGRPADAAAAVNPGDDEAAIRQRRDLRDLLIVRGGGVDQDLAAYLRAVRVNTCALTATLLVSPSPRRRPG